MIRISNGLDSYAHFVFNTWEKYKTLIKLNIAEYWQSKLRADALKPSLKYFKLEYMSLHRGEQDLLENLDLELLGVKKSRLDLD